MVNGLEVCLMSALQLHVVSVAINTSNNITTTTTNNNNNNNNNNNSKSNNVKYKIHAIINTYLSLPLWRRHRKGIEREGDRKEEKERTLLDRTDRDLSEKLLCVFRCI